MTNKLRIGVRGGMVVVFMPDGSHLCKPIPEGVTEEQAILQTIELLVSETSPELQN